MIRWKTIGRPVRLIGMAVAGEAAAQEVKFKFHHFSYSRGWDGKVMVGRIVDLIESGCKGRISIKVFPDMQLGGQPWALVN